MIEPFHEGWTERIRYALTHDEDEVLDLTGMTVALVGKDGAGTAIDFSGATGTDDATAGIAYFDPAAGDLVASGSPYRVRWKITDGDGKVAFFPREAPLVWRVTNP